MKRTGPPQRRTPLAPGKPLAGGGPLRRVPMLRKAPMPRSPLPCPDRAPAKPKRKAVTAEERQARALVAARSGGTCEGCNAARATDWSHRVGAGVGGKWCASNGMHKCRACHDWIGDQPEAARAERGWRLRSTDDPAVMPALHAVHGWVLLDADGSVVLVDEADARQALAP